MASEATPKRLFITGVSSGFGRALTETALAAGHTVIGTVRNGADAERIEALGELSVRTRRSSMSQTIRRCSRPWSASATLPSRRRKLYGRQP